MREIFDPRAAIKGWFSAGLTPDGWFDQELAPNVGGGSTTGTGDPGAYALNGAAATGYRALLGVGDSGTLAITGAAGQGALVGVAVAGSYAITGAAGTGARALLGTGDAGSYAITGATGFGGRLYVGVGDPGSYSLTGAAGTGALAGVGAVGAYALTGAAAIGARALVGTGDAGVYLLTGTAAEGTATVREQGGDAPDAVEKRKPLPAPAWTYVPPRPARTEQLLAIAAEIRKPQTAESAKALVKEYADTFLAQLQERQAAETAYAQAAREYRQAVERMRAAQQLEWEEHRRAREQWLAEAESQRRLLDDDEVAASVAVLAMTRNRK